jgi:dimethylargininase
VSTGTALVRRPSPRLREGLLTHIDRCPVDYELAVRQWRGYVDAVVAAGWNVVEVPPADDCPDSVFVEDTVVVFGDLAVIARPGAHTRVPETAAVETVVAGLGLSTRRILAPGTLDGGDVLKIGSTVYVGRSVRTNADGVEQLRALLAPRGATVIPVPVTRVLHLKSAVTALPDGAILGYPPLVDDPSSFGEFCEVPEASGAHVVLLGGNRLLMASDAPRTGQLFTRLGYEPITVDISEFQKLEGCVTCLSVRIRRPAR